MQDSSTGGFFVCMFILFSGWWLVVNSIKNQSWELAGALNPNPPLHEPRGLENGLVQMLNEKFH